MYQFLAISCRLGGKFLNYVSYGIAKFSYECSLPATVSLITDFGLQTVGRVKK